MTLASIVDWAALLKVVWVSLVAGIGVAIAFSLVVFGAARGGERRRERTTIAAVPFYVLAVLGLAACAWALVQGYDFVVTKS